MQILNVVDPDIRALVRSATGAELPSERSPAFLTALDELQLRHPELYAQVMSVFARPASRSAPLGRPAASLWRRPVLAGSPVLDVRRIGAALVLCGLAASLPLVLSRTGPLTPSTLPSQQAKLPARPSPRPAPAKAPLPSAVVIARVAGGAQRPKVLTRTLPTPPRPVLIGAVLTEAVLTEAVVKESPAAVRPAPPARPTATRTRTAPSTQTPSTQTSPSTSLPTQPRAPLTPVAPEPAPVVAPVPAPRPVVADSVPKVTPVRPTPGQEKPRQATPGRERVSRVVVAAPPTAAPRTARAPVPAAPVRQPVPATASVAKAAAPVSKAAAPVSKVTASPAAAPAGDQNLLNTTTDPFSLDTGTGGDLNVNLDPPASSAP